MYASGRHHFIFFLKEKYKNCQTVQVLGELNKTQWLSQDELRELQWKKLKILLRHAYKNVPYYHSLFKGLGLLPRDFKDFEDLKKIPLLTKQLVRKNVNRLRARNFKGREILRRTSGSTGMPLKFPSNSQTDSYSLANAIRGRSWWGLQIGDSEFRFWGISTPFEKTLKSKLISILERPKDRLLSSIHLSPFDTSQDTLLRYYHILLKRQPKLIFGYGVAIYIFVKFIADMNLDLGDYHPDVVIYTTETLYSSQKDLIKNVFDCSVVSEYGSVEMGIIAYECPKGNLHLSDETLYAEVVESPEKGFADGYGEIVLTHLTNFGFPFIRYNQGDIVSLSSEKCSCGRGLSIIRSFSGRSNDLIQKPNGEYIHPELFDYIMRYQPGVSRYRVIEESTGHLRLLLEMDKPLSKNQKENLHKGLLDYIEPDFKIDIEVTERIPNDSSGKFRWVISQQSFLNANKRNNPPTDQPTNRQTPKRSQIPNSKSQPPNPRRDD